MPKIDVLGVFVLAGGQAGICFLQGGCLLVISRIDGRDCAMLGCDGFLPLCVPVFSRLYGVLYLFSTR